MERSRSMWFCALAVLALSGCGGHPSEFAIYAPYPRYDVFKEVENKIVEMGYTVQRSDTADWEIVADRPVEGGREEITAYVAPDETGVNKLVVTSARVLPATEDRPIRRVSASSRTNADANAVIQMYMKARKRIPPAEASGSGRR